MYTVLAYSDGDEFEYEYKDRARALDHFYGEEHAILIYHNYIDGIYEETIISEK